MTSDFAKDKVFWTERMNLKLVKYIQNRPNMWNPKHPNYTSMRSREQTFARFASKYDNILTAQTVKERWTNIRSTFCHYLRKSKAKQLNGDEDYKINWHLWEACQFLRYASRKNKNEHNVNGENEVDSVKEENQTDDSNDDNFEKKASSSALSIQCSDLIDNIATVFKNVEYDRFHLDNSNHGRLGKLVAEKLSQLDSYNAAVLTNKITEILLLYDSNNPSNPNNIDRM